MEPINKKDLEKVQGGISVYVDTLPSASEWDSLKDHDVIYIDRDGDELFWNNNTNKWQRLTHDRGYPEQRLR